MACAHDGTVCAAKIDGFLAEVVGGGRLRLVPGSSSGDHAKLGAVACDEALDCIGDGSVELCVDFLFWYRFWVVVFFYLSDEFGLTHGVGEDRVHFL